MLNLIFSFLPLAIKKHYWTHQYGKTHCLWACCWCPCNVYIASVASSPRVTTNNCLRSWNPCPIQPNIKNCTADMGTQIFLASGAPANTPSSIMEFSKEDTGKIPYLLLWKARIWKTRSKCQILASFSILPVVQHYLVKFTILNTPTGKTS